MAAAVNFPDVLRLEVDSAKANTKHFNSVSRTEQPALLTTSPNVQLGSGYFTSRSVKASETSVLTCVEMFACVTLR